MSSKRVSKNSNEELKDDSEMDEGTCLLTKYLYKLQPEELNTVRGYAQMKKLLIKKYNCPEELIPSNQVLYRKVSYVRMMKDPKRKAHRMKQIYKQRGKDSTVPVGELVVDNNDGLIDTKLIGLDPQLSARSSDELIHAHQSKMKQENQVPGSLDVMKAAIGSPNLIDKMEIDDLSDDDVQIVENFGFTRPKNNVLQEQQLRSQHNNNGDDQSDKVNEARDQYDHQAPATMEEVIEHFKVCRSCAGKAIFLAQACHMQQDTTISMAELGPIQQSSSLHPQSSVPAQNQQLQDSENYVMSFTIQWWTGEMIDFRVHNTVCRAPRIKIDLDNLQWANEQDHQDNAMNIKTGDDEQTQMGAQQNERNQYDRGLIGNDLLNETKPPIMLGPVPKLQNAKQARQARKIKHPPILIEDDQRKSIQEALIRHAKIKIEAIDDGLISKEQLEAIKGIQKSEQEYGNATYSPDLQRKEQLVNWLIEQRIIQDENSNELIMNGIQIFKDLISNVEKKREVEEFLKEKQCRLGGYLGSGGEAAVFKVLGQNGRTLCVRVEEGRESRKDIIIRKKLSSAHPYHEVQVFGHSETTNYSLTLMDFLPLDLCGFIKASQEKVWHPVTNAVVMYSLTNALLRCHDAGVAHLDLKSSNCLLDCNLNVVLTDFTGAKDLGSKDAQRPLTMITPNCMPPEFSYSGDLRVGQRIEKVNWKAVDIWQLGLVFSEIVRAKEMSDRGTDQLRKYGFPGLEYEKVPSQFKGFFKEVDDLLMWIFANNPRDRPDCREILDHDFFSRVPLTNGGAQLHPIDMIPPFDKQRYIQLVEKSLKLFDEGNFEYDELLPNSSLSPFGAVANMSQ